MLLVDLKKIITENWPFSTKITIFGNFGPLEASQDITIFDKLFDFFKAHIKRQLFLHCHIKTPILIVSHHGVERIRARFMNLPVINKPWFRTSINLYDPLSVCPNTGNRFILGVMDLATHFPLAFPLRTQSAFDVVRCLISVFVMFGIPDEMLSDCVTEFLSDLI